MGKTVTRDMADDAAERLAVIAFEKKIADALEEMKKFGDKLIEKYIPAPVLACGKEYRDYFYDTANRIEVSYTDQKGHYIYFPINSNRLNPLSRRRCGVSEEDGNNAMKLRNNYNDLCAKQKCYITDVSNALVKLRSQKNVMTHFPEALPYLNFSDTTAIVPNYENLRMQLK